MIRKKLLKAFPYILSIFAGSILFIVGSFLSEDYKSLIINISAAFLAIPALYLIYELSQKYSHRKLNREIFDYAKMQIDRELLYLLNHLSKLVYSYAQRDPSIGGMQRLLSLNLQNISAQIKETEFLGFQIYKTWTEVKNIQKTLESPFILGKLNDEQIISLILILKLLRSLELVHDYGIEMFALNQTNTVGYRVVRGTDINEKNIEYPDRFLLLKDKGDEKFITVDFGDFEPLQVANLLNSYRIKDKFAQEYAESIYKILQEIKTWLNLTGNEFLLDTKAIRLASPSR